ncbi:Uncharacterized protein APZ42_005651 [Daphnia magna]|uniref:Uncharacterized protein n=1 Tax=Daphnia magna TaxID=35525 RepID=A0A164GBZ8_9CRUS|nr:Uncharacterized protein APZ42_005651 [Daphnia magna]
MFTRIVLLISSILGNNPAPVLPVFYSARERENMQRTEHRNQRTAEIFTAPNRLENSPISAGPSPSRAREETGAEDQQHQNQDHQDILRTFCAAGRVRGPLNATTFFFH